jgi:hypothetical protein
MANKDVKQYYYAMQAQYLEMKEDLADFEQALADGFITEEQLAEAKSDIEKIESNYERLSYIMYLMEMPNRADKKAGYANRNKDLVNHFSEVNADQKAVNLENCSALDHLRKELKNLKVSR